MKIRFFRFFGGALQPCSDIARPNLELPWATCKHGDARVHNTSNASARKATVAAHQFEQLVGVVDVNLRQSENRYLQGHMHAECEIGISCYTTAFNS